MDEDWENLADQDNVVIPPKVPNVNKWEGEDEEEDVKESWEDEEEEKKDEEKVEAAATPKAKPKKSIQEKIQEKERLRLEQEELLAQERLSNMTPEERAAEKLRLQKLQEEIDLKTALETLGVTSSGEPSTIDSLNPTNKAEFSELAEAISKKVSQYKNTDEYPGFVEELIRSVCANLNSTELKKIKATVDNLHIEKQKMEKEKTKKPSGKGKTKIKLRVEGDSVKSNNIGDYSYGDYGDYDDDFM